MTLDRGVAATGIAAVTGFVNEEPTSSLPSLGTIDAGHQCFVG